MKHYQLSVLAVGDPAVYAYTDPKYSIVDKFSEENDIDVKFQIVPFTNYYSQMIQSLSKSHEFDIVMVAGHLWVRDLVDKGFLVPIDLFDDIDFNHEDIFSTIREELMVDGIPYLIPSFCDGHIFVYRKSLVQSVLGKSLPEVVDTDTMIQLVKNLDGKLGMRGIALKAHPSEIFLDFLPYLRQEGVDAYDKKSFQPTFYNPAGVNALKKYCSLRKFSPLNTEKFGNDEVREAFQQKKVAAIVTWGGQLGFVFDDRCIDKDDVGFAVVKTAWNVTWSFAIDRQSPKKEMAKKFLKYLASKEVDRIIGAYAGSPVRKSTYQLDSANYPWYPVHFQLINRFATPLPKMPLANERNAVLYHHVFQAFIGKETPEEALRKAEQEILQIVSGG